MEFCWQERWAQWDQMSHEDSMNLLKRCKDWCYFFPTLWMSSSIETISFASSRRAKWGKMLFWFHKWNCKMTTGKEVQNSIDHDMSLVETPEFSLKLHEKLQRLNNPNKTDGNPRPTCREIKFQFQEGRESSLFCCRPTGHPWLTKIPNNSYIAGFNSRRWEPMMKP